MAWKDSLQDASFRGVRFDVIRTRDNADRDTASHEYPYLDGADIEDLGRKARGIHLTAIVWGDDYEHRLRELLKVLDEPGHGELVHPVFGSIAQAQLLGYAIEHDADSPDYCTLELSFAEATPGNPFFDHELPEQQAKAVGQLADTARSGGIDAFASALDSLKGMKNSLSRLNALRSVMTGTLWAIKSQVGGIISTTLDLIDYPRAFASDLTGLIGSMADLRGFDTAVLKADWKSLASDMDGIVKLPARTASGAVTSGGSGSSGGPGGIGHDADNAGIARARARKLLSDARLKGLTLDAEVTGHRTSDGVLWQPGQRIHVISEPHGLDGVYFLMARRFRGGRGVGTTTALTLKEDGVWTLDAHPGKRGRKRLRLKTKDGKELEAIDVGGY
ncbi:DNA circularization N-terminal domain-containing protein [Laribacter hongkongensis]|uniref:DNA circularization N-terminal domain-containing protein n=1 Tax=Laribacter hongkongensis TaxID=168471 RepID=UPI001EFE222A|nr:DNA circularization N-terminal domain-containing protein [Laribacter hongkongensis]MCG9093986.1 DNA circularization N-terminal domain-containing protein [Laribacter hongkongensis]